MLNIRFITHEERTKEKRNKLCTKMLFQWKIGLLN